MNSREVIVTVLDQNNFNLHTSFFNLIQKHNKYFELDNYFKVAIVSTNHITVGLIGLSITDNDMNVHIFQAPRVCRLSILSLIESTVPFIQSLDLSIDTVKYHNINSAYLFRLNSLFDRHLKDTSSLFDIPYNDFKLVNIKNITNKKIIID